MREEERERERERESKLSYFLSNDSPGIQRFMGSRQESV